MSTIIRISDSTFERLKALAEPLVDTPATVIDRVLDFYDKQNNRSVSTKRPLPSPSANSTFDPEQPPDLTHTRVLAAVVGEKTAGTWNGVHRQVHRLALLKLKSFEELRKASLANIVQGRRVGKGFEYLKNIDTSIQNREANVAWREALHLAKKAGIPLEVEFRWQEKQGAARPGQKGSLLWEPHH